MRAGFSGQDPEPFLQRRRNLVGTGTAAVADGRDSVVLLTCLDLTSRWPSTADDDVVGAHERPASERL